MAIADLATATFHLKWKAQGTCWALSGQLGTVAQIGVVHTHLIGQHVGGEIDISGLTKANALPLQISSINSLVIGDTAT